MWDLLLNGHMKMVKTIKHPKSVIYVYSIEGVEMESRFMECSELMYYTGKRAIVQIGHMKEEVLISREESVEKELTLSNGRKLYFTTQDSFEAVSSDSMSVVYNYMDEPTKGKYMVLPEITGVDHLKEDKAEIESFLLGMLPSTTLGNGCIMYSGDPTMIDCVLSVEDVSEVSDDHKFAIVLSSNSKLGRFVESSDYNQDESTILRTKGTVLMFLCGVILSSQSKQLFTSSLERHEMELITKCLDILQISHSLKVNYRNSDNFTITLYKEGARRLYDLVRERGDWCLNYQHIVRAVLNKINAYGFIPVSSNSANKILFSGEQLKELLEDLNHTYESLLKDKKENYYVKDYIYYTADGKRISKINPQNDYSLRFVKLLNAIRDVYKAKRDYSKAPCYITVNIILKLQEYIGWYLPNKRYSSYKDKFFYNVVSEKVTSNVEMVSLLRLEVLETY